VQAFTKAREAFQDLNRRLLREEARKLGERLRDGKITPAQFQAGMEKELKSSVVAAYRFEVKHKLTDGDLARVNGVLERQGAYLHGFVKAVGETPPGDWIPARAELYAGAAREAQTEGRFEAADDTAEWLWSGPDGPESCEECLDLIGTTRTVAEWRDSGDRPGGMTCGSNCRCELG